MTQRRGDDHQILLILKHIKGINFNPYEILLLLQIIYVCV